MRPGFGITPEPAKRERVKRKAPKQKRERPERSEPYLAFVRSQPCMVTGARTDIEAHHWASRGAKAMGAKVSDFHTVPLHRGEHRYWHDHGHLRGMTRTESEDAMNETKRKLWAMWGRKEEP